MGNYINDKQCWDKSQFLAFDLLRFPLALAVIFIHMSPETFCLAEASFPLLSGQGLYNVVAISLSNVICQIAVPVFFVISGYLFFRNLYVWSWDGYMGKIKSRTRTLVVPYLLWNILAYGMAISKRMVGVFAQKATWDDVVNYIYEKNWHVLYDGVVWDTARMDILGNNLFTTGPIDVPLWFLRDLIVVSFMAPVVYFFIKKARIYAILVLFVAYVTRLWPLLSGFSITAFFYFSVGAYFAVYRINIIAFVRRFGFYSLPFSLLLFFPSVYYNGPETIVGDNIYPFYILFTVFSAFFVSTWLVENTKIRPVPLLVKSCFFVYALHKLFLLQFVQQGLHAVVPGVSGEEDGFCYLASPIVAAVFCVCIYVLFSRFFPKATSLFCGNR